MIFGYTTNQSCINQEFTMNQTTTLRALKQSFRAVLPGQDGRTALSPLEFVSADA
jgi:hypothetical protein